MCFRVSFVKFNKLHEVTCRFHLKVSIHNLVVLITSSHSYMECGRYQIVFCKVSGSLSLSAPFSQSCSMSLLSNGSAAFDLFPLPCFFSVLRAALSFRVKMQTVCNAVWFVQFLSEMSVDAPLKSRQSVRLIKPAIPSPNLAKEMTQKPVQLKWRDVFKPPTFIDRLAPVPYCHAPPFCNLLSGKRGGGVTTRTCTFASQLSPPPPPPTNSRTL